MRARPNLSGEQIVTDYMTRVAQAARLLPKGARMAFVGRTRALVEREVGPPGTRTDPEHVTTVLARLGKPEDLVTEERTRIDQRWVKSRASNKEEGEAAAAAVTTPRAEPALEGTARSSPDTQPLTGRLIPPGQDLTVTGPDGSVIGAARRPLARRPRGAPCFAAQARAAQARVAQARAAVTPASPASAGCAARTPRSHARRARFRPRRSAAGHRYAGRESAGHQSAGAPVRRAPGPGDAGHTGPIERLIGQVPGLRGMEGAETFTANTGRLARENVLESVAILLLGLGGLILPFPFWPIGAIVAMFSRVWDVKDKAIAVIGPMLVTLALSVIAAPFVGGSGNVIVVYFHALGVSFGLLVRVGSVITAAYLAWRVSKGPRVKVPPWKRITR